MGYLLLGLLAVVAILLGIAVVRALMIKAPAPATCDTVVTEEECAIAAEKLGAMVRIPSVSKREDEDLTEFYKLHEEKIQSRQLREKHLFQESFVLEQPSQMYE